MTYSLCLESETRSCLLPVVQKKESMGLGCGLDDKPMKRSDAVIKTRFIMCMKLIDGVVDE